ncbi:hypothetical protein KO561_15200 [Radiobacillus kanasensis]|uniref:hypothetical protein n=1 Tax=Radiobacillus kanasensis TaxID=2844358 RepID=UPI001E47C0B8|nr:hypothetical protein [Radiobacillus kanasensis]UFT98531.1 hypothetical protein KO561_15200 [Radiobacillus kanasensis]
MAEQKKDGMKEDLNELLNRIGRSNMNEGIPSDKTSTEIEKDSELDKSNKNERHNENARASAAVEPENPRINTDNL